jgi:hypothetical protein
MSILNKNNNALNIHESGEHYINEEGNDDYKSAYYSKGNNLMHGSKHKFQSRAYLV